jgi:RNA polymerase sigma factor (sigma-70 family)
MAATWTTRASLLARLAAHPGDAGEWRSFVALYAPPVIRWARRYGLQDSDAADVAQEVLLRFWKQAGKFRYDPDRSFRGYLRRMVLSAVSDWSRERKADPTIPCGDATRAALAAEPAREDLAAHLERVYDTELLSLAMSEVERRVHPRTWQAFRMLAIDNLPGRVVADRLGMDPRHVYVARSNVQAMIRRTLGKLGPGVAG